MTRLACAAVVSALVALVITAGAFAIPTAPLERLGVEPVVCLTASAWNTNGYPGDADGVALLDERQIVVRQHVCDAINRLPARAHRVDYRVSQPWADAAANAAVTIAHEHAHLAGYMDESDAECLGLQGAVGLLRRLGVSRTNALWMVAFVHPAYPLKPSCRVPHP
jgi:hypothetical protein